jgi:hypothetical protein
VRELESAIGEFIDVHNEQPKPFVWTKSADAILKSIGRFAPALGPCMAQILCKKSMTQETKGYLINTFKRLVDWELCETE